MGRNSYGNLISRYERKTVLPQQKKIVREEISANRS